MHDLDPIETQEWLEALDSVLEQEGEEARAFSDDTLVSACSS